MIVVAQPLLLCAATTSFLIDFTAFCSIHPKSNSGPRLLPWRLVYTVYRPTGRDFFSEFFHSVVLTAGLVAPLAKRNQYNCRMSRIFTAAFLCFAT